MLSDTIQNPILKTWLMLEKFTLINNPLTIIGVFAAVTELGATVVLPVLSLENQGIYLWFLMAFPVLLVVLFFTTLLFNHRVMYAPSDFEDESDFFRSFRPASQEARERKLLVQLGHHAKGQEAGASPSCSGGVEGILGGNIRARYSLAEERAMNQIAMELRVPVMRNMSCSTGDGSYVFDGLVRAPERTIAVEVQYFGYGEAVAARFKREFSRILDLAERFPEAIRGNFSLILAVVVDGPEDDVGELALRLREGLGEVPFPVDVKVFSMAELRGSSWDSSSADAVKAG
ncbi:hypothetical protein [Chlorobium phaeovibrioides]|uniref:hypothetical protein n=2 Tax=Chlorobium phaeovibrioides TaxID=1094 RepID=UPI000F8405CA|nr:hypothetical protein [Chlorobium phaeovibrioides]